MKLKKGDVVNFNDWGGCFITDEFREQYESETKYSMGVILEEKPNGLAYSVQISDYRSLYLNEENLNKIGVL